MRKGFKKLLAGTLAATMLAGMTAGTGLGFKAQDVEASVAINDVVDPPTMKYANKYRCIGYCPDWDGTSYIDQIDWSYLTHAFYSFAIPTRSGTVEAIKSNVATALVNKCNSTGTLPVLSLGGWSAHGEKLRDVFAEATSSDSRCKELARNTYNIAKQYGFKGIDVDWEYPTSSNKAQFTKLINYLYEYTSQEGWILTAALPDESSDVKNYPDEALAKLDFINVMCYFNDKKSSYSTVVDGYNLFASRFNSTNKLNASKIVVGIPFYARRGDDEVAWEDFASKDNFGKDSTTYSGDTINYNGRSTLEQKCVFAANTCGGMMIWDMTQDVKKNSSLYNSCSMLKTMHDKLVETLGQGATPTNTPKPTSTPKPTVTPTPVNTNDLPVLYGTFREYTEDSDNTTKDYVAGERVLYNGIIYEALIDIYVASSNTITRTDRFIPVGQYGGTGAPTDTPTPTKKATNTPTPTKKPTNTPTPTQGGSNVSGSTWAEGKSYSVGDLVVYNGKVYECIVAHTSIATWTPDVPTLWKERTDLRPEDVNGDPTPTATSTPKPTATSTPKPTATSTPKPTATSTPKPTATQAPSQNGWVKSGPSWFYYKNGAMVKGWLKSGGKWYYLDPSTGVMQTGMVSADGKTYFLNKNGDLATNKWVQSGSEWYHTNTNGEIQSNKWIKSSGKWYYLGADGRMVTSQTIVIKGVSYTFDKNGVWQEAA